MAGVLMEPATFGTFEALSNWSVRNCRSCEKNSCFMSCNAHEELSKIKPFPADSHVFVSKATLMFIGAEGSNGTECWRCPEYWNIRWGEKKGTGVLPRMLD
jgi:hypothetical protein